MELSKDTLEVLEFLDYTTGGNLRKRNDLGAILEIGAMKGDYQIVEKIIFTGKYLWNLHSSLIKAGEASEGTENMKREAVDSTENLKVYLSELISDVNGFDSKRFDDVYFPNEQGAFRNLIDLAHDLSRLKDVQIQLKNR